MKLTRWIFVAITLAAVRRVNSQEESDDDSEIMQNDPDAAYLDNLRIPHVRGALEAMEDERSLLREERKRVKAERRRFKEERRQERLARRRQQKQAGHRTYQNGDIEGYDDPERDDLLVHRPDGGAVTLSSSSSTTSGGSLGGVDGVPPQAGYRGDSSSSLVSGDATPLVIDMEWMRANLSSLWSVVRSFSKQQGRPFLHRGGGRGRHHHSGVVRPPNPESCPGVDDACQDQEGEICGGHGSCSCGYCFCNPGFYGTFCQCDDHSCPLYDGMACGGPSRGQCRCGGCVCRIGYTGESCDCPTDTHTCLSPDNDQICSGKGTCQCGRCQCSDGHKGMYCEDTVYAAGVCEKLKHCVMCRAWNRDLPTCAHCQITVTTVESLEPSMTTCVMVNSGCLLQFSYIPQTADAYTVLVPRDMVCPE